RKRSAWGYRIWDLEFRISDFGFTGVDPRSTIFHSPPSAPSSRPLPLRLQVPADNIAGFLGDGLEFRLGIRRRRGRRQLARLANRRLGRVLQLGGRVAFREPAEDIVFSGAPALLPGPRQLEDDRPDLDQVARLHQRFGLDADAVDQRSILAPQIA